MVRPETVRIPISDDDWIEVRKRLNAGEARRVFSRMVKTSEAGKPLEVDTFQIGRSQAVAYLVNWSLAEFPIRDEFGRPASPDVIGEALDTMDMESFTEITTAIANHEKAMDAERSAEKNGHTGSSTSEAISVSAST